ncbi:MAG: DUF1318 domain-containing protein, partial [Candidatus Electrothrix sp. MAN1_4]|nr:DUF1318 domain-containing protein [Candidatus Electrothrix sp. MAN1_4]
MKARQARIEALLQSPDRCLGEGLDGLLTINASCSAQARSLAEEENNDREKLHKLMAEQLGISEDEIVQKKAKRYRGEYKYIKGVLRQIEVPETREITWWDGYPPDPRKTAVSRVLIKGGGVTLYAEPNADSSVARDNVQQYEAFGVLDSMEDNSGTRWYQVTDEYVPKIKQPNWSPNPIGWVAEDQVIPWRRAVVMRFTNPYNRQNEPSLFFENAEPLRELMQEADAVRKQSMKTLQNQVNNGQGGASGVVAVEPHVGEGQEQMIMYPVLDFDKLPFGDYHKDARILEVAARTRDETSSAGSNNRSVAIDILFVMDTTHSMQPYLENVLAVTKEFARQHADDGLRFGFVGYQDKN